MKLNRSTLQEGMRLLFITRSFSKQDERARLARSIDASLKEHPHIQATVIGLRGNGVNYQDYIEPQTDAELFSTIQEVNPTHVVLYEDSNTMAKIIGGITRVKIIPIIDNVQWGCGDRFWEWLDSTVNAIFVPRDAGIEGHLIDRGVVSIPIIGMQSPERAHYKRRDSPGEQCAYPELDRCRVICCSRDNAYHHRLDKVVAAYASRGVRSGEVFLLLTQAHGDWDINKLLNDVGNSGCIFVPIDNLSDEWLATVQSTADICIDATGYTEFNLPMREMQAKGIPTVRPKGGDAGFLPKHANQGKVIEWSTREIASAMDGNGVECNHGVAWDDSSAIARQLMKL